MAEITVRAEIAGRVLSFSVEVGTTVATGDEIALIESMKMEIPIVASVSGKIATILVQIDDMIDEGQPILTIET